MKALEGKPAPDFSLPGSDGKIHSLADYRGKTVVLYFYPKDDTPGCTKEACKFRDLDARLRKKDAVVLGVSKDSVDSHRTFASKFGLPFVLLSDADTSVMTAYGAWGEKIVQGQLVKGTIRGTTMIGPDGRVIKHWPSVQNTEAHPEEVLAFMEDRTEQSSQD